MSVQALIIIMGALLVVVSSIYRKRREKKILLSSSWEPVLRPWSLSHRILWTRNVQLHKRHRDWSRWIVAGIAGLLLVVGLWSFLSPKFTFISIEEHKDEVKANSITFIVAPLK